MFPELAYHVAPLLPLPLPVFADAGISVWIKREDMNHPTVSGNKWWKLKYNLAAAQQLGRKTIVTFGGAFSNHLYATAAATHALGLHSIGIVRGEKTLPLNSTLQFACDHGMRLVYMTREEYRKKEHPDFLNGIVKQFGDVYVIPEGGTNNLAVRGVMEFAAMLQTEPFTHLVLPVGTGGTIAGLVRGLPGRRVVGVSVLKGDFSTRDVQKLVAQDEHSAQASWTVLTGYHHGGYAKSTPELRAFIQQMQQEYALPLDPVYTAKMMWALVREAERGAFAQGSKIIALHTGGLQARNRQA